MLTITAIDLDHRLRAFCANVRASYRWYLAATKGAENNLKIQRKIIAGSKSYATLRNDLAHGCILPPIVLAIDVPDLNSRFLKLGADIDYTELQALRVPLERQLSLTLPSNVYIIDGLQRTNALREVARDFPSNAPFFETTLRLEIWLNISFSALAYRMLLLNAGQRPMSIKHQVEILSQNLKSDIQNIPQIEIMDFGARRVRPGQFQLSKISLAFQAWLQGSPNVDVRNIVVEQMLADSALETLGAAVDTAQSSQGIDSFRELMKWFVQMDFSSNKLEFFGSDTVLQGIAAAVGQCQRNAQLRGRTDRCLAKLSMQASQSTDALAISAYEDVRRGIDPSKKNVGEATRDLVFSAFQEFIIADGLKSMQDCWHFAGAR